MWSMLVVFAHSSSPSWAEEPYPIRWTRQFGSGLPEYSTSGLADGQGNFYIAGHTSGKLGSTSNLDDDAYLAKLNSNGGFLWVRQLGISHNDRGWSISNDSEGNIYLAGRVAGTLAWPNGDFSEGLLAKYDLDGTLKWAKLLTETGVFQAWGVSADSFGNAFIAGWEQRSDGLAFNAVLAKYDEHGTLLWTNHVDRFEPRAVATDTMGNVFITGGQLGDAIIAKYDSDGEFLWDTRLRMSFVDSAHPMALSVDLQGNVYVTGDTGDDSEFGRLGARDGFVAKYDPDGELVWGRTVGTNQNDGATGISVDGLGGVYISGWTQGSLGGPNAGPFNNRDAFVAKYDAEGDFLWAQQFGTGGGEQGTAVASDLLGNVFLTGDGFPDLRLFIAGLSPEFSPGDINLDGSVDLTDFALLKNHFDLHDASREKGDLNKDKTVDLYDFDILKQKLRNNSVFHRT